MHLSIDRIENYKTLPILSAFIDAEIGVQGSCAANMDWLTDEKRFLQVWIEAVHTAVKQTRNYIVSER